MLINASRSMQLSVKKRCGGYTLIELLLSISMGLAMMSIAMQYLVGSSTSFRATESAGRIQENARFALSMITEDLRMAGYVAQEVEIKPNFFFTDACDALDPCTANGADEDSDRIAIWQDPPPDDGSETDCTASALGATDQVANVYYVETSAEGVNSLVCRGFNVTTNLWNAGSQPLIDGIDSMQILYGITAETAPNSEIFVINSYVSADAVVDWDRVVSVRIVVLVSTGLEDGSSGRDSRSYEVADAPELTYDDAFNRRVFSTTVVINNAIQ